MPEIRKLTVVTSGDLNSLFVSPEAVDNGVKAVAVITEEGNPSSLALVSLQQYIEFGGTEEDFNTSPVNMTLRSTNFGPYMKATQAIQDSMFSSNKAKNATLSRGADFKPPESTKVAEIHSYAVAEHIIVSVRGLIYKKVELRPQSGELVQFLRDQPLWREMILNFAGNYENFNRPTDTYKATQTSA